MKLDGQVTHADAAAQRKRRLVRRRTLSPPVLDPRQGFSGNTPPCSRRRSRSAFLSSDGAGVLVSDSRGALTTGSRSGDAPSVQPTKTKTVAIFATPRVI